VAHTSLIYQINLHNSLHRNSLMLKDLKAKQGVGR